VNIVMIVRMMMMMMKKIVMEDGMVYMRGSVVCCAEFHT
jgi:hypothetical protein